MIYKNSRNIAINNHVCSTYSGLKNLSFPIFYAHLIPSTKTFKQKFQYRKNLGSYIHIMISWYNRSNQITKWFNPCYPCWLAQFIFQKKIPMTLCKIQTLKKLYISLRAIILLFLSQNKVRFVISQNPKNVQLMAVALFAKKARIIIK